MQYFPLFGSITKAYIRYDITILSSKISFRVSAWRAFWTMKILLVFSCFSQLFFRVRYILASIKGALLFVFVATAAAPQSVWPQLRNGAERPEEGGRCGETGAWAVAGREMHALPSNLIAMKFVGHKTDGEERGRRVTLHQILLASI